MQIEDSITVNAPIGITFSTFSDVAAAAEHLSGVKKVEVLAGDGPGVGFRWRETRVMFGKEATEEMWMTELDSPHSYAVEAESNGTKYRTTFEFKEVDESTTEVRTVFSGTPVSLIAKILSLVGRFMMGSVKKAFHQDLVDLKSVAEQAAQT